MNITRHAAQTYAARARAAEIAHEAKHKQERRTASWLPFWGRGRGDRVQAVYSQVNLEVDDLGEDEVEKGQYARREEQGPPVLASVLCCGVERRVWVWIGVLVAACILLGVGVGVGVGLGFKNRHTGEPETASAVRPTMVDHPSSSPMPSPPPLRTDSPTGFEGQPSLSQSDLGGRLVPTDQPAAAPEGAVTFSSFPPDEYTPPTEQPVTTGGPGAGDPVNSDWYEPTSPTPTMFPDTREGAV